MKTPNGQSAQNFRIGNVTHQSGGEATGDWPPVEATDGATVRFALDLELREAWLFWGALPMYIYIYIYYSSSGGSPRIFFAFSLDKTVFPF